MQANQLKTLFFALACLTLSACANNKNYAISVQSDPLGAYTLMQIKQKDKPADWIYLGTTPIKLNRSIEIDDIDEISFKVMRPGFHERIKTWQASDFYKEHKSKKKILWLPKMVRE